MEFGIPGLQFFVRFLFPPATTTTSRYYIYMYQWYLFGGKSNKRNSPEPVVCSLFVYGADFRVSRFGQRTKSGNAFKGHENFKR